jgi:hypothetical protein
LTTSSVVVILSNMNAELLLYERHIVAANAFVEMVVWRLPSPLSGSHHSYKYRLAFVIDGRCVLRYDNETGKGDHRHEEEKETRYVFTTPQALLDDFWNEVDKRRS